MEGVGIIPYFWYRACFQHIPFCTTSIARRVLFWRFSDPWSSRFQVTSHLLMCLSTASMVSRRHEWHHFFESLWTWIDNEHCCRSSSPLLRTQCCKVTWNKLSLWVWKKHENHASWRTEITGLKIIIEHDLDTQWLHDGLPAGTCILWQWIHFSDSIQVKSYETDSLG